MVQNYKLELLFSLFIKLKFILPIRPWEFLFLFHEIIIGLSKIFTHHYEYFSCNVDKGSGFYQEKSDNFNSHRSHRVMLLFYLRKNFFFLYFMWYKSNEWSELQSQKWSYWLTKSKFIKLICHQLLKVIELLNYAKN